MLGCISEVARSAGHVALSLAVDDLRAGLEVAAGAKAARRTLTSITAPAAPTSAGAGIAALVAGARRASFLGPEQHAAFLQLPGGPRRVMHGVQLPNALLHVARRAAVSVLTEEGREELRQKLMTSLATIPNRANSCGVDSVLTTLHHAFLAAPRVLLSGLGIGADEGSTLPLVLHAQAAVNDVVADAAQQALGERGFLGVVARALLARLAAADRVESRDAAAYVEQLLRAVSAHFHGAHSTANVEVNQIVLDVVNAGRGVEILDGVADGWLKSEDGTVVSSPGGVHHFAFRLLHRTRCCQLRCNRFVATHGWMTLGRVTAGGEDDAVSELAFDAHDMNAMVARPSTAPNVHDRWMANWYCAFRAPETLSRSHLATMSNGDERLDIRMLENGVRLTPLRWSHLAARRAPDTGTSFLCQVCAREYAGELHCRNVRLSVVDSSKSVGAPGYRTVCVPTPEMVQANWMVRRLVSRTWRRLHHEETWQPFRAREFHPQFREAALDAVCLPTVLVVQYTATPYAEDDAGDSDDDMAIPGTEVGEQLLAASVARASRATQQQAAAGRGPVVVVPTDELTIPTVQHDGQQRDATYRLAAVTATSQGHYTSLLRTDRGHLAAWTYVNDVSTSARYVGGFDIQQHGGCTFVEAARHVGWLDRARQLISYALYVKSEAAN